MLLVAGSDNLVRVNGHPKVTAGTDLHEGFARGGTPPRTVILMGIEEICLQCTRAVWWARIWKDGDQSTGLPTVGAMLVEMSRGAIDGAAYDAERPGRAAKSLWWGRARQGCATRRLGDGPCARAVGIAPVDVVLDQERRPSPSGGDRPVAETVSRR